MKILDIITEQHKEWIEKSLRATPEEIEAEFGLTVRVLKDWRINKIKEGPIFFKPTPTSNNVSYPRKLFIIWYVNNMQNTENLENKLTKQTNSDIIKHNKTNSVS